MKNFAESMPNPAQQPEQKRPKFEDEDIEGLLKGIEEHDAAKARDAAEKKAAQESESAAPAIGGLSAAKNVRAILDERLGEAMIVTNEPKTKAYGMFMTVVDTVRREVRAPSLEDAAADPARLQVATMINEFVRQEVRSAFHAALKEQQDLSTLDRERTRIQELMDVIDRTD
jgi:hypothetical protein